MPRDAAAILRSAGWDAQHVGELGLGAASDERIIEQAIAESRVVITLDADFHALVAVAGDRKPSVIRIRREGLRGPELATLVIRILEATKDALSDGALVSVTEKSIRMHKLPIGGKADVE